MSDLRPIIINQSDLEWEGWDDPEIAAKSPVRWKLLITSERGPSNGIVIGIAEVPPGESLLLHHHEPEETYYVISGNGHMEIDDYEGRTQSGFNRLHPSQCKTYSLLCGNRTIGFHIHLCARFL